MASLQARWWNRPFAGAHHVKLFPALLPILAAPVKEQLVIGFGLLPAQEKTVAVDVVEVRRVGVHERRVSAAAQGVGEDAGGQGEAVVLVLVPGGELRAGLGARRAEVLLDVEPGLQVMAFAEDQPCVRGEVEGGQCTGCGQLSLGDVEFVIDDGAPEVDVPFSAHGLRRCTDTRGKCGDSQDKMLHVFCLYYRKCKYFS